MDHVAAVEQQFVSERKWRKLNEVNMATQAQLGPVQDHINFTLQKAYFKCAYECFDRSRKQEEISNCVEHCSVPLVNAQQHFENEMAKFQMPWFWIILEKCYHYMSGEAAKQHWTDLPPILLTQERLNRSLMVCQNKFESAKFQQDKTDAINELESCVDQSIEDNIKTLPHLVGRLKASFNIGA
ncbi:uncharacterized protein LOC111307679 isoform X1 [Durio zibethinus]|uniref:Uncharacterized protein LOC111307679 isoform X1 n=1 Tax=Durio zibethinus TaxID=66656 RepID=A0A6P6A9L1_DURZI|nr:uncharacterized protein LOC111307679 isoform X1 [Durio zibethinus]